MTGYDQVAVSVFVGLFICLCVKSALPRALGMGLNRAISSFHLSWVLGPIVPGWLQNLKTSEDTFGHEMT